MALKQCEAPFPDESSQAGYYDARPVAPQAAEGMPPQADTTRSAEDEARQHAEAPGTQEGSNASSAQHTANRKNAQHSTGPKTPEGKARSSQNARKHGLFSRDVVEAFKLQGADADTFEAMHLGLIRDAAPENRREQDMVERLASLTWRLDDLNRKMLEQLAAPKNNWLPMEQLKYWDLLGKIEARTSREASKIHRDIAFLQRYRLDRRARIQKLDGEIEDRMENARRSEADLLRLEIAAARFRGTPPRPDAESLPSASVADGAALQALEPAENPPETAPEEIDPVEMGTRKDSYKQPHMKRQAKQTQSEIDDAYDTPRRPDDGSIDLT